MCELAARIVTMALSGPALFEVRESDDAQDVAVDGGGGDGAGGHETTFVSRETAGVGVPFHRYSR